MCQVFPGISKELARKQLVEWCVSTSSQHVGVYLNNTAHVWTQLTLFIIIILSNNSSMILLSSLATAVVVALTAAAMGECRQC